MVEFLEYAGPWAPGIIAILGGAILVYWTISLPDLEQEEEKTELKVIIGKKEEKLEKDERKAA